MIIKIKNIKGCKLGGLLIKEIKYFVESPENLVLIDGVQVFAPNEFCGESISKTLFEKQAVDLSGYELVDGTKNLWVIPGFYDDAELEKLKYFEKSLSFI